VTTNMFCLPDGDEARAALLQGAHGILHAVCSSRGSTRSASARIAEGGSRSEDARRRRRAATDGLKGGGPPVGSPEEIMPMSRCTRRSASISSSIRR
jgi:hypothetical protein